MAEPVSIITGALGWLSRLLPPLARVPSTVERHNRDALRIYEDLTSWALDDARKQDADLAAEAARLAGTGMLQSGERGAQEKRIRDAYAERWRNRKRQALRDIEELYDQENLLHKLYRRRRNIPWPENPRAEEIEALAHDWDTRLPG